MRTDRNIFMCKFRLAPQRPNLISRIPNERFGNDMRFVLSPTG